MRWHRSVPVKGYASFSDDRMTSRSHHEQFRLVKLLANRIKHPFAERTGEALFRTQ